jgi:hypothetical protein
MGQHVMTDTPKPPPPGPINPDDHTVLSGIAYDNRQDAYLAYCYKLPLSPAQNLLRKQEYKRSKKSIFNAITKGQKEGIPMYDLVSYVQGNPLIESTFEDYPIIQDLLQMSPIATLGSLRRGSEDDRILSGIIDVLLTKFMTARSLSTRGKLEREGKLAEWANGSSDEEKDLWASDKYPKPALAPRYPPFPDVGIPTLDAPFAGSPGHTPPRPVGADEQGFDEHVSYTAPELQDDETNDTTHAAERRFTFEIHNAETRRRDKMTRARRQRKREFDAKVAGVPFEMEGEQVEGDEDDAEGWVTDDSTTAENGSAGPSRQADTAGRAWNNVIGPDDPRHRQIAEMLGIRRAQQDNSASGSTPNTTTEAERQAARAALAVLMKGGRITPPIEGETRDSSDDDDGSRYPTRQGEDYEANRTMWAHGDPTRPDLRDDVDLYPAVPVREDDDADDDADDDEQEDEDEQDEPRDEPVHVHDFEDPEGLDHDDWNGVLEGTSLWTYDLDRY